MPSIIPNGIEFLAIDQSEKNQSPQSRAEQALFILISQPDEVVLIQLDPVFYLPFSRCVFPSVAKCKQTL